MPDLHRLFLQAVDTSPNEHDDVAPWLNPLFIAAAFDLLDGHTIPPALLAELTTDAEIWASRG